MKKLFLLLTLVLPTLLIGWAASTVATGNAAHAPALASSDGDDDDDDDPEPYVEPPFTVFFSIDRPEAVYFTVNDLPVELADDNSLTVDPGDGYIKAHVRDGYAFTKFTDDDAEMADAADYLQYDRQTMPVTIRKTISSGMDESSVSVVDGHHFTIETFDTSTLLTYTLTIEVDDPAKVDVRIGTSADIISSANRKVELESGVNPVTYTEADLYLHVAAADFREPLYSVTCNGKKMVSDGALSPTYSMQLKGSKTQGSAIVIVANAPVVEDAYHFTANIDDASLVYSVKRLPANKNVEFAEGANTWGFNDGDTYEIWCSEEPKHISLDGTDLQGVYSMGVYVYTVIPTDGGVLDVVFKEAVPGFNFYVDDASRIAYLMNDDTEEEYELVDGNNFIPLYNEGTGFTVSTNGVKVFSFTCDGTAVPLKKRLYSFTPSVDSNVVVYFSEPQPDPKYTVKLSFAVAGTEDVVDCATIDDNNVSVADLMAGVEVDANAYLWLSYSTSKYTINDITVNGVSRAPFNGVVQFPVTEDTEICFDVEEKVVVDYDKRFVMILDDVASVTDYAVTTAAAREIELYDSFNEIAFNSDYDGTVTFSFAPAPAAVYLNGELMSATGDSYEFEPADGDIVRVYLLDVPEKHDVAFDVDEKAVGRFTILRDLVQEVDHQAGTSSELHGTYYVIVPADGVELSVTLRPIVSARSEEIDGIDVPYEDGMHMIQLDGPAQVAIKCTNDATGIGSILTDSADEACYNLQGVRVGTDLRLLPAGVYIRGGKKIIIVR